MSQTSSSAPNSAERIHASEWVLIASAFVYIGAYALIVLMPDSALHLPAQLTMIAVWVVFVVDYLMRLAGAERRGRWFVRNLPELAIVLLPMLRPLRLLRLLIIFHRLQASVGRTLHGRLAAYAVASATLLIFMASLAVLDAERGAADAEITSYGDAVWWSIVTVTTVGYGDTVPVTAGGRLIAVLLMFGGISLIGVITGLLASTIVKRVSEEDEANENATRAQVDHVDARIGELKNLIGELTRELADARQASAAPKQAPASPGAADGDIAHS
ncbi:potassium channel family protein [Hoyosella sp. YIM 151337]|uniref:potassium channel family protein n=1 Tax=Hoyosella sp. YIM 151337 TaxID=2992742 RepID=UPI00223559F6|nr:potassium channel family protein [Hoyosella sp. YIM 151337]MCW4355598.1 potassium channel family protein [Hoyosella sp. YIM 151337]